MSERLLLPSQIPEALWKDAQLLRLCPCLAESYRSVLESAGLLNHALKATSAGDIGGETAYETNKHFTQSFSGSCGRVQLAMLDPHEKLEEASNLFIKAFSGGKVGLLDVPCGSGAASVSILATIAALRRNEVIPRTPLDISLVAGDIAATARDNASRMIEALRPSLKDQAIFINARFVDWDVLSSGSTINLLHAWMEHTPDCREYFVITANFSGFLHFERKFQKAQPQLEQVLGWAGARNSTVAWIEPQTNEATGGMWQHFKRLWGLMSFFKAKPDQAAPEPLLSEASMEHPLRIGTQHQVRLSLVKLARNTK